MNRLFQQMISDNEQDLAEGKLWWQEASLASKLEVLKCINRDFDDPAMEVMSRFAQLSFCRFMEELGDTPLSDAEGR
jgi:hypothetical protein